MSQNTGRLRLLAIDDGDDRVYATLHVLDQLMRRLNDRRRDAGLASVKPCEVFDLIVGVGLGGLAATLLGRLEMDVSECMSKYIQIRSAIPNLQRTGTKYRLSRTVPESSRYATIFETIKPAVDVEDAFLVAESRKCRVLVHFKRHVANGSDQARSYALPGVEDSSSTPTVTRTIVQIIQQDQVSRFRGIIVNAARIAVAEAISIWGHLAMPTVRCLVSVSIKTKTILDTDSDHEIHVTKPQVVIRDADVETEAEELSQWLQKIGLNRYFGFDIMGDRFFLREEADEHTQYMATRVSEYFDSPNRSARIADCVRGLEISTVAREDYPLLESLSVVQHMLQDLQTTNRPASSSVSTASKKQLGIKPCYLIGSFMMLVIAGSAAFGLYWTIAYGQMGDAFTAAGWIVAVGTLIVAVPIARHYANCTCWKKASADAQSESDSAIELHHLIGAR